MTRKSRRDVERELDDIKQHGDPGRPLTAAEAEALGDEAEKWGTTPQRRAMYRALCEAAREARA